MDTRMRIELGLRNRQIKKKIDYEKFKSLNPGIGDKSRRRNLGKANEILVAAAYLRNGFEVFEAVGPNMECDLIVFKRGQQPLKVEVKTGYYSIAGTKHCTKIYFSNKFDVLAVVYHDGVIEFCPEIHMKHKKRSDLCPDSFRRFKQGIRRPNEAI